MKFLGLIIFVIVASAVDVSGQGWRGIVPLRSTRADVERLLGPPEEDCQCDPSQRICRCHYTATEGRISVDYAPSACGGYPSGWNVPKDTVLRINLGWKEPPLFSELRLDESQFDKALDDTFTFYYASRSQGVEHTVSSENRKKRVTLTSYIPTHADSHLRCPCFPSLDDSTERSVEYDKFSLRAVNEDDLARLDNYIIALQDRENFKGYVLLYKGKHTNVKTAVRYRQAIARHFYRTRGVPREQLVIVDAGYQEQPFVELFMMSRDLSPPEPRATWKPCKQGSSTKRAG